MPAHFNNAFRGRSVLVTGHTGFKGSWLALWLSKLGAQVSGYSLEPPTQPNHFELCRTQERLARHYVADVRDVEQVQACLNASRPEVR
jgi:CDP-glucose 4,6-dehydratase